MNKTILSLSLISIAAAGAVVACTKAQAEEAPAIDIDRVFADCHNKVSNSLESLKDSAGAINYMIAPRNIAPGQLSLIHI